MTALIIGRDKHSIPNATTPFSTDGQYVTLAASGTASINVPADNNIAVIQIQPGATVLVGLAAPNYSSSATPQAGTFDINPSRRSVVGGTDILYFEAIDAAIIKVSFYNN